MMKSLYEEDISVMGEWWLASQPDRLLPGALTFSQVAGGRLSIVGGFEEAVGIHLNRADSSSNYGRICGAAEGKRYTLEDCFQVGTQRRFGGQAPGQTEQIHVGRALRGIEYTDAEQPTVSTVDFRMLHMPYWAGGWFGEDLGREKLTRVLEHRWAPTERVQLANGMTLEMHERFGQRGDRQASRTWDRDWVLRLEGPLQDLGDYLMIGTLLQHLVTFGTGRPSTFESVQARHPNADHTTRDGQTYANPFDVFSQWTSWEARNPQTLKYTDMRFTLDELGGIGALGRWVDRVGPYIKLLNRVVASTIRRSFVDDRLFARAAALEGFDRRRSGQRDTFADRIGRCLDLAGPEFESRIGDRNVWIKRLKTERDEAAHHFDGSDPTDGAVVHWLAETADALLVLCLLRLVDADDAALARVVEHESFRFATEELRDLLGT